MNSMKMTQIKLSKDNNNGKFFNVESSYQHLVDNINKGCKNKEQQNNSQHKSTIIKNSNVKGTKANQISLKNFPSVCHSFNLPKGNAKGKSTLTMGAFDILEKQNNNNLHNNQRINPEVNLNMDKKKDKDKVRDLSPLFYSSIKTLNKSKKDLKNKSTMIRKNNLEFYEGNTKKKQTNSQKKFSKNLSENSGNYEVCITEPEKPNTIEEKKVIIKKNLFSIEKNKTNKNNIKNNINNNISIGRSKKSLSPEIAHKRIKININQKIPKKISYVTNELKSKFHISNSKNTNPKKKDDKTKEQKHKSEIGQYSTIKDLNININTNININSPLSLSQTIDNTSNNDNNNTLSKEEQNNEPEIISINSIFDNKEIILNLSYLKEEFDNYEKAKYSVKSIGNIKAYGANTYQGIIRNYNEDRVSIILNIAKPPNYNGDWPKCSLFGIYDGHGGCSCADFLRDKLHTFIIKDSNFPLNPHKALIKGFEKAEEYFIYNYAIRKGENTKSLHLIDKSGSCAIVALIVENICYIANVGDSRGLISLKKGKEIRVLTTDHKPNEEHESLRIISNGGKIYQTQTPTKFFDISINNLDNNNNNQEKIISQILIGPYRVFPGRLSVSRTIGDAEAKLKEFGGMKGVVIGEPEISNFSIDDDVDFLMLGCDGIFDQLTNEEIANCVWMTLEPSNNYCDARNVHEQCMFGVDMIMKTSLMRKTLDNITVVLVAFKSFEEEVEKKFGIEPSILNIGDSFQQERLETEPEYNFTHEKIRLSNGLKNREISVNLSDDYSGISNGLKKSINNLPGSSKNILAPKKIITKKKKNFYSNVKFTFSPKINVSQKISFFSKGKGTLKE